MVFLLGLSPSQLTNDRVREEASLYGDIALADFGDHYNNLTLKSVYTLKYLLNSEWVVRDLIT